MDDLLVRVNEETEETEETEEDFKIEARIVQTCRDCYELLEVGFEHGIPTYVYDRTETRFWGRTADEVRSKVLAALRRPVIIATCHEETSEVPSVPPRPNPAA